MKNNIKIFMGLGLVITLGLTLWLGVLGKEEELPPLLDRNGSISATSEWLNTKKAVQTLQVRIKKDPHNFKAKLLLALGYIQEARITGEHPYYYPAALNLLNDVLDERHLDASLKYESLIAKATVQLALHQFSEALVTGKEALKLNEFNSSVYGVLCDAYVELGNYEEAVKMADKMVSIRPDIRSYARVSYLREIHGDMNGAIEAMNMAASSGYPGLEQTSWTKVTLGGLYEKVGDLQNAEKQYRITLYENPHYAFAIAGLARVESKKKNYTEAIKLFEKASEVIPEFSFQEELVHLYKKTGQEHKVKETTKILLEMLEEDADAGHSVDLELANIYLDIVGDKELALEHAMKEFKKRPENIDVCFSLSHIYYKLGDISKAKTFMQKAKKTNKNIADVTTLEGLILIKSGDKVNGYKAIKKSFEQDPFQTNSLSNEAQKYLTSLAKL